MKKYLIMILVCLVVICGIYATFSVAMAKQYSNSICKTGCCSRHGGVCGCKNNSALCCDGSLSPTCGCQ